MYNRLNEYHHKCDVLKQIQSEKALFYRRINNFQNFLVVIVSALITFIGFSGIESIQQYVILMSGITLNLDKIQLIYNLSVFVLFAVTIFHLVFQFGAKQTQAEKAVWVLANLINEIATESSKTFNPQIESFLLSVEYKYNIITQTIPANTDKDYKKAKKKLSQKDNKQKSEFNFPIIDSVSQKKYILNIIEKNHTVSEILSILSEQSEDLYLGGGIIRNLVWDDLHGYSEMTPIEDIDVIYFNNLCTSKEDDLRIEEHLKKVLPNYTWSVKNQARMHIPNGDEPYLSLNDAVSKWPEIASAILLKRNKDGTYTFVAPFEFEDLFRLIVRPTPHFMGKLSQYQMRVRNKKWNTIWDKLILLYLES